MKKIDGISFYSREDYISPADEKVEAFTRKYLKFFLGVALTVLVIAYIGMIQDILRTFEFLQSLQAQ